MAAINLGAEGQTQKLESQGQELCSRDQIRDVTIDELGNSK